MRPRRNYWPHGPRYQQEIAGKLILLRDKFRDHQAVMVVMWDAFYTPRKLARNQQEKIAHLI
ncbi:MAG: hypothetical protein IPP22_04060 [Nitrosomonas sp.]|nr:hypothetical protein [Nitrosomonas sp.]